VAAGELAPAVGTRVAGTVGYLGFGLSLIDALFQTVITASTVGFGEARPFGSGAKVFTIVLIFVGVATAAYTFGVGIESLVEGYLDGTFGRRRMQRRIGAMRGHMILCGWGRVGQAIARRAGGADMVVVDASAERIGTVSGPYVRGDATSEEVLRAAGIGRARVLVTALNADADNLYVTLTARSMAPGLFIVSRAGSEAAVGERLDEVTATGREGVGPARTARRRVLRYRAEGNQGPERVPNHRGHLLRTGRRAPRAALTAPAPPG
jgi:voltage-gated potassium channel